MSVCSICNGYPVRPSLMSASRSLINASQQGDLGLSGPPSGLGADGGARNLDRRIPADLRADSLTTVPPTPLLLMHGVDRHLEQTDLIVLP
ncbi:hypothetical protein PoB_002824700 [Plakobranchus ocellatus]|uniref:Uncharacterized protein n=1 Tax=Plakobranchus ocellatus TaxID=259542 RepID=A0AAV4A4C4_9GAST|nr:hypothetical protein PoB_002824700 [Plakobranchus ocellatus]